MRKLLVCKMISRKRTVGNKKTKKTRTGKTRRPSTTKRTCRKKKRNTQK